VPLLDPAAVDLATLRVLVHDDNGIATPTPATGDAVHRAANALEPSVGTIEEGRPPGIEQTFDLIMGLWGTDGGAATRRLLRSYGTTESSLPSDGAPAASAQEIDALIHRWDEFRRTMLTVFERSDVLLSPVHARPAQPHGTSLGAEAFLGFSYTMTHNLSGWPGAVVRCGTSEEGLPIGVQVVAAPWREDLALAVAAALEGALGGFQAPVLG